MKIQPIKTHQQEVVMMEGAIGARMRMLIGPTEGARNFHMRHFEVEPGGCTPFHKHDYEHEIDVFRGKGMARTEKGDRPIKAGDVIYVAPNEMHQFRNSSDEPIEFICLIPAPCDCAQ